MLNRLLQRMVAVEADEVRPMLLSALYFFLVMASYFIIRPLRDEMGIAGGVRNLPWLFTGTLVGMLLAHPIYTAMVSRLPRRRFIPLSYNLFAALHARLSCPAQHACAKPRPSGWAGSSTSGPRSSTSLWSRSSGRSWRTSSNPARGPGSSASSRSEAPRGPSSVRPSPPPWHSRSPPRFLLLVSIAFIELAVVIALILLRSGSSDPSPDPTGAEDPADDEIIGGGVMAGIAAVFRSPYLLGIVAYMLFYTVTSTFLYFEQAEVVADVFADRAARTVFFARLDLAVNILTIITQIFLTGRIVRFIGIAMSLAWLPLISVIGFFGLGLAPTLGVIAAFQIIRRASNYAVTRPCREMLYTVLPRETKYKAKNFIDTFVYRAGDQVGAWSYAAMGWLGLGMTGIAFAAIPLAGAWMGVGFWLGRKQAAMRREVAS